MPIRDTIRLAFEALFTNKLRSGLTMLGMIIGVGSVVLLVSIGNGARNYITAEFEGIGTNLIMVQPGKLDPRSGFGPPPVGSSKRRLTLADVDALEKLSFNLDAVTGMMLGSSTVKTYSRSCNTQVLGSNEKLVHILNMEIGRGQFFTREESEFGRRVVVLGFNVADKLFPGENPLGRLVKVAEFEHRVVGVVAKTGDRLGFNLDEMILIPTRTAMRVFNDDKLFGIRAKAKSKIGTADAVEEVRALLRARHDGQEDFTLVTQGAVLNTLHKILGVLTYVLAGIATISMIVGGIGIMNIMLVSVTERTREIGIRRAVGARRSDLLRQFLSEAVVLSFCGGFFGLVGSVGLTHLVYLLTPDFDLRAPLWIFAPAFGLSLVTGVVFGVWPARRAAGLSAIDALRFE